MRSRRFASRSTGPALILLAATTSTTMAMASPVPTGRLPRDVELESTALELRVDPGASAMQGRTTLAVDFREPREVFWLHGRELTIDSASIATQRGETLPLKVRQVDVSGVLEVTAPERIPAGKARVTIAFSAPYGQLQGAYKVRSGGNDYILTHMEPLGARNAFPGFDEPGFKKPWDITLIVRQEHVGVANTRLVKEQKLDQGWKKLTFARTGNLPSYLVAFAVGPWDVVESRDIPPSALRKTPLKLRGIAARGQGRRMSYALDHTAAIVQALETYFGTAYPYDKLDLLAAPDFAIGAMENAGLIVYRDSLMFADDDSAPEVRQSYWIIHAHELAHQWFGNLVSISWWDDTWLKEAFATWMGIKIAGQLRPDFHTDRNLQERALLAMSGDSLASTRRVREPINDFTDVRSAFDGITYSKGGGVLRMFERYVGEERFRNAVRDYLHEHSRGNATSADLIRAIAARSEDEQGVRAAFDSFIDQPGVPFVRARLDCADASRPALAIEQTRYLPLGSTASRSQRWHLPLCVRYEVAGGVKEQCELVTDARAHVRLQANTCPAWVMPNAHGAGYYRFVVSDKDRPALDAAFDKLEANEQRAYADSLAAAFRAGAIDADAYLRTLPRLAAAPVRLTVTSTFSQVEWMIEQLARDAPGRERLRELVVKLYGPRLRALGLEATQGEADEDRLLRASLAEFIALTGEEPALRADLARRGRTVLGLRDGAQSEGSQRESQAVSVELRGLALKIAVQDGDHTAFDVALEHLRASQDPVLRRELVAALGSVADPSLAKRARALALQPELLRLNEIFNLLNGLHSHPQLRAAQRDWLDAEFQKLAERLSPTGAGLLGLYAEGLCSAADAEAMQSRFTERVRNLEGGPRMLAQTAEAVRLCGALREAQSRTPLEAI